MNLPELHSLYCHLTGLNVAFTAQRRFTWERWWFELRFADLADPQKAAGEALTTVIKHIQSGQKNGRRKPGALKFRNIIENAEAFEEDLAECRALMRRKVMPTGKAEALRSTGRDPTLPEKPARPAAEVLQSLAAHIQQWRKEQ